VIMSGFFDLVGGSSEDLSFRHGGNGGEEVILKLWGWYAWELLWGVKGMTLLEGEKIV